MLLSGATCWKVKVILPIIKKGPDRKRQKNAIKMDVRTLVKIPTPLQQEDVSTLVLTFLPPMRAVWLLVAFLISLVPLVPRSHNTPCELWAAPLRVLTSTAFRALVTWKKIKYVFIYCLALYFNTLSHKTLINKSIKRASQISFYDNYPEGKTEQDGGNMTVSLTVAAEKEEIVYWSHKGKICFCTHCKTHDTFNLQMSSCARVLRERGWKREHSSVWYLSQGDLRSALKVSRHLSCDKYTFPILGLHLGFELRTLCLSAQPPADVATSNRLQ